MSQWLPPTLLPLNSVVLGPAASASPGTLPSQDLSFKKRSLGNEHDIKAEEALP